MIQKIKDAMSVRFKRFVMRRKYQQCHNMAFKIVQMGQEHCSEAQGALDDAKDSLYFAASVFKKEENA